MDSLRSHQAEACSTVQIHDGKIWDAIAALVPGHTERQCRKRWHGALDPRIVRTTGRTGEWTTDEDTKLKHGVHTHDGKDWDDIALLVPGLRWKYVEFKDSTVRK